MVTYGPNDEQNHVDLDITFKEFSDTSEKLAFTLDVCKDILSQVSTISQVPKDHEHEESIDSGVYSRQRAL